MFDLFDFMPKKASTWAHDVDWINNLITDISVICIFGITAVMLYFAVKYRRRSDNDKTAYITHNTTLETVWTVVPTIICFVVFYFGFVTYREMRNPPTSSLEINVDAHKWRWEFLHANGKKATNELVVPVGTAVRLIMKSHDVLHSFFIPAMRVKEDVLPSGYSQLWFDAIETGEYPIFCAEYCGLDHSGMRAKLRVVSPEEYRDYLADRTAGEVAELPPAEAGKLVFNEKGCTACHSLDGTKGLGPSLKGLFSGSPRELADGTQIVADENYVAESILTSQAKLVKGFQPVMPVFQGQLDDKQVANLIAYLKTL